MREAKFTRRTPPAAECEPIGRKCTMNDPRLSQLMRRGRRSGSRRAAADARTGTCGRQPGHRRHPTRHASGVACRAGGVHTGLARARPERTQRPAPWGTHVRNAFALSDHARLVRAAESQRIGKARARHGRHSACDPFAPSRERSAGRLRVTRADVTARSATERSESNTRGRDQSITSCFRRPAPDGQVIYSPPISQRSRGA